MKLAAALLGAAVLLAGCGGTRSALGPTRSIGDVAAVRDARAVRQHWASDLYSLGRTGPTGVSGPISPHEFGSRLVEAAGRYQFTVKRLQYFSQGSPTPLVIVTTKNRRAFARATPAIERTLDPYAKDMREPGSARHGWAFLGFFLEAQDTRGVPFLIVQNVAGHGGQWARNERLVPFAHG